MAELSLHRFDDIRQSWQSIYSMADTKLLFSSPSWSENWWNYFGQDDGLYLGAVTENSIPIGIAPLKVRYNRLKFIGSDNVCDFLDFIVQPGMERTFCCTLLDHLKNKGFHSIELGPLLPDSTVLQYLMPEAINRNLPVTSLPDDVTVGMKLPADPDSYLQLLSGKQRHELLRKERRLLEEGEISYNVIKHATEQDMETFLHFFRESREDKNKFLTDTMESFFKSIVDSCSREGTLQIGAMHLNSVPVATTLCFDHRDEIYLYNSGYNPDYRWLSVGLISKYYCIRESILQGKHRFDFLKGAERYKFHLGGTETPLFRCIINL